MALQNTAASVCEIGAALAGKRKLWFIGVGGVHMSVMARYCAANGYAVGGSDRTEGAVLDSLRRAGVSAVVGHDAAHIQGYDAVIFTLALDAENPEYRAALSAGIPTFSRANFLAFLTSRYPCRIGVAGSHGKSTVTAMLAEIFTAAGRDPAVFCGAPLPAHLAPPAAARGRDCIFEACEYGDSFLCFCPTLSVVLNVEWDHVDYFPTSEAICRSFARFAALPRAEGSVLVNAEDAGALSLLEGCPARPITFGITRGDCHATALDFDLGRGVLSAVLPSGRQMSEVTLRVAGRHNVQNALAAAAAADACGIPPAAIAAGLCRFRGVGRRMEYRGVLCGARVFDDYAHHPAEIRATLGAAREMLDGGGRLFVVFQSHTYSRTAALLPQLCDALRGADRVLVADIYAARESDTRGMSAALLAAGVGRIATAPGDLSAIAGSLLREVGPGDLLVVMGAGDIDRIFGEFSPEHFTL